MQQAKPFALRHVRWLGLRIAVALTLLLGSLFALDQELHHCLHEHADEPSHECLLTSLANGLVEISAPSPAPMVPTETRVHCPVLSETCFVAPSLRLPPSCGPPRA